MCVAVTLRDDRLRHHPADRLRSRPAERQLRLMVPVDDQPTLVYCDECLVRALKNRPEIALGEVETPVAHLTLRSTHPCSWVTAAERPASPSAAAPPPPRHDLTDRWRM